MAREFMHFAYFKEVQKMEQAKAGINPVSIDDFTNQIEELVQKMIDAGEDEGMFRMTLPENLPPEKAVEFIDEVMRRLNERFGG